MVNQVKVQSPFLMIYV